MRITWQINADDIAKLKAFYDQHSDNPLVKSRIDRNLRHEKPPISKGEFWDRMVGCLLTTRQRSGPESPVTKFLLRRPSPLDYELCIAHDDLAGFACSVIRNFGGLQRSTTIGKELAANLSFLKNTGWEPTFWHLDNVRLGSSPQTERQAAEFIDTSFKGFGPKQSRNLLQGLRENPGQRRFFAWRCVVDS